MSPNDELEQRTYEALIHAKELGVEEEDLLLLCWHAGVDYKEITDATAS